MNLTSGALLGVVIVLACILPLLALMQMRGPRALRALQRLALIGSSQLCAVLVVGLLVNNQYGFYTSWDDLLGRTPPPPTQIVAAAGGQQLEGPAGNVQVFRGTQEHTRDGGRLITETVHGSASGVSAQVIIHLPAGYDTSKKRYPVVELVPGWHNYPDSWITNLHFLEAERAAQRKVGSQPFIAVMPSLNIALPRDTECTDVPGGPKAETWLSTDVHNLVLAQFRALPNPQSWGVIGYSTGGYCAAKMVLHHPELYHSAVVMSGYFHAIKDQTTGDLWGKSARRREENDPLWLVTHRTPPAVSILVFANRQDRDSYPSSVEFLRSAHAPLQTYSLLAPEGGHNYNALRVALPDMLTWMSAHLTSYTAAGVA